MHIMNHGNEWFMIEIALTFVHCYYARVHDVVTLQVLKAVVLYEHMHVHV